MSRIYHNTSLQNKPVHSESFDRAWSSSAFESGPGVLLEGKLLDVSRHAITDSNNQKVRFYVLYIKPSRIHQRRFDASGKEVEPNFSDTKKVNTGFLMSSYKVEAKGESDRLSEEQLSAAVNKAELVKITDKHRPAGTWAFWHAESDMENTELETGQEVRLKTRGNSPFICFHQFMSTGRLKVGRKKSRSGGFELEALTKQRVEARQREQSWFLMHLAVSLAKIDGGAVTKCNFAGDEKAGASWTDKIMANKADGSIQEPGGGGEGAEEDEWED